MSSIDSTRPRPNKYAQYRFTRFLAKYGLLGDVIQSARAGRGSALVVPPFEVPPLGGCAVLACPSLPPEGGTTNSGNTRAAIVCPLVGFTIEFAPFKKIDCAPPKRPPSFVSFRCTPAKNAARP